MLFINIKMLYIYNIMWQIYNIIKGKASFFIINLFILPQKIT